MKFTLPQILLGWWNWGRWDL